MTKYFFRLPQCRFLVEVANTNAIDSLCTQLQTEGTTCKHKYYRVFNGFAAEVQDLQTMPDTKFCSYAKLGLNGC